MTAVVLQTFGEALGSLFGGLALIAIAIMALGIGFIIFAIVLIIFMVKRHRDKKNGVIKVNPGKDKKNEQKKKKKAKNHK